MIIIIIMKYNSIYSETGQIGDTEAGAEPRPMNRCLHELA
jgi:hypothetical protein